ncbi:unnamed protein product [Oppiella nova]|uniref:Uncharacterized protein n=1 Tax=Oppiella nova TaxID=334625 RepID=A0A7R9MSM7_9ACAR|nr:unnamed protein product [Oppiella nova]CAG2182478.1 unnamed protein product [Oppiella nova]
MTRTPQSPDTAPPKRPIRVHTLRIICFS